MTETHRRRSNSRYRDNFDDVFAFLYLKHSRLKARVSGYRFSSAGLESPDFPGPNILTANVIPMRCIWSWPD